MEGQRLKELLFVKGYKEDTHLRESFNQLADQIFGIQFETWYQHGYWTEKYQPYSFVDNGKVVANVSVNLVNLIIDHQVKQAVQIGTVMTHPDYRNRGLSKILMDRVLADYQHVDLLYLFANQSVLDFYPKFGFEKVEEIQFSLAPTYIASNQSGIRKLDGSKREDLAFIHKLATERNAVSNIFGTINSEELFMFYCLMVFPHHLYYLENEQALVIYQVEENVLHLYDVVCGNERKLKEILSRITPLFSIFISMIKNCYRRSNLTILAMFYSLKI
jgi:predicted acetyltransferase